MIWRSAGQLGDNSWFRLSPNAQEFSFASFSLRLLLFIHQFSHFLHFTLAVLSPVLALMLLFICLTNGPNYFLYIHTLLGNIVLFYYFIIDFIISPFALLSDCRAYARLTKHDVTNEFVDMRMIEILELKQNRSFRVFDYRSILVNRTNYTNIEYKDLSFRQNNCGIKYLRRKDDSLNYGHRSRIFE